MSTRSRDFGSSEPYGHRYWSNYPNIEIRNIPASPIYLGYEHISWVDGVWCNHREVRHTPTPPRIISSGQSALGINNSRHEGYVPFGLPGKPTYYHPFTFEYLDCPTIKDVEKKIVNPNGLNMLTSLAEIGDLQRTAKDASNAAKQLGSGGGVDLSKNYLTAQFGALPIISDVRKIRKNIRNQDRYFRRLFDGNRETVHWKKENATSGSYEFWANEHPNRIRVLCEYDAKWTERYTVVASWSPPTNPIRPLLDFYGLQPDASDVWALVPLSFVVDWVVDVGGALEKLDTSSITTSLRIHSVYHSMKHVETRKYRLLEMEYWDQDGSNGQLLGSTKFRSYKRNLVPICQESFLEALTPQFNVNRGKALTLGALLDQVRK